MDSVLRIFFCLQGRLFSLLGIEGGRATGRKEENGNVSSGFSGSSSRGEVPARYEVA